MVDTCTANVITRIRLIPYHYLYTHRFLSIDIFPGFSPLPHVVRELRSLVCLEAIPVPKQIQHIQPMSSIFILPVFDVPVKHTIIGIAEISPQTSNVGSES